jgi:hypothetical protein
MIVLPNENIGFLLDIQSWGDVSYSRSLQCEIVIEEMLKRYRLSLFYSYYVLW